jgi:hypothetical protein
MSLDPSSRDRLTPRQHEFFPGDTLFDHLARAVCDASALPRKELYEAWEVARRVRRRFRGGRVVDLAAGAGLVGPALLLLDHTSPGALCVDPKRPPSSARLWAALVARWPRLESQLAYREASLDDVALAPTDLVVSVHACGSLTDRVLARALAARCRVAVLPCCHDLDAGDDGGLRGWVDGPLAQDLTRAARLRAAGFTVRTQAIPSSITPKNRLLLAAPPDALGVRSSTEAGA